MSVDSIPGVTDAISPEQVRACQKESTYASSSPQGICCSARNAACEYRAGDQCNKWRLRTREEMSKVYQLVAAVKEDMNSLQ